MRIVKTQEGIGLSLTPAPNPKKRHQPRVVVFPNGDEVKVHRQDSRWKVRSERHGWFSAVTLKRLQRDLDIEAPGARIVLRKR